MRIVSKAFLLLGLSALLIFGLGFHSKASATVPYINERVSLDSSGNQATSGDSPSNYPPKLSQDGRYVLFASSSPSLVSGDTNNATDLFLRDRESGTTTRANVDTSGDQMTYSTLGSIYNISANGRYAVFSAYDPYWITKNPGNSNNYFDVFVRDLQNDTTTLVSKSKNGNYGGLNGNSLSPDISADGRYITFMSSATDLVSNDTNGYGDIFVKDMKTGTISVVDKSTSGGFADRTGYYPSISCDGAYITFNSNADNLVVNGSNQYIDTYIADRINNTIEDITTDANDSSEVSSPPHISCDGTKVFFESAATNIVTGDTNGQVDLFAYTLDSGATQLVNIASDGTEANHIPDYYFASNFDGRYITFSSYASNLVSGDANGTYDIFLKDLDTGDIQIVSKCTSSTQTSAASYAPSMSEDGKYIVYVSSDSGLVSGDTNGLDDTFISETGD